MSQLIWMTSRLPSLDLPLPDAVAAISHLWEQLRNKESTIIVAKTVALCPSGHAHVEAGIALLAGIGMFVANWGGSCWGAT